MTTTKMPTVVTYEEIGNRLKNGALAGAGTFAIMSLTCYRTSQEMYYEPDIGKVLKVSAIISAIAAFIWSLMPKANQPVEESINEVKQTITAPINVFLARVLKIQKDTNEEIDNIALKMYRERTKTSTFSTTAPWTRDGEKSASYMRGWNKLPKGGGPSMYDSDIFDDDDPPQLTEEEEAIYSVLDFPDDDDVPGWDDFD